ncbi:hypothetical protein [Nonomuraea sp. NPDC050643]|uniref:hypothetical protein n=1 Tax=Nonomuraea sp. NPDC050643 TaxID=3155660 RepID=UPI0033EA4856
MAAYEARNPIPITTAIDRHRSIRFAHIVLGYRSIAKVDTRSYGAAEANRSVKHLNSILDDIGCPDTPAEHRLQHVPCPPESKEPLS